MEVLFVKEELPAPGLISPTTQGPSALTEFLSAIFTSEKISDSEKTKEIKSKSSTKEFLEALFENDRLPIVSANDIGEKS
jgi:hypothetical protein